MDEPLFSLVLPAYNPGPVVARTWAQLMRFLDRESRRWEIIFVCDGCRDGSDEELAKLAGQTHHAVRVLRCPTNRGKGRAVRRGLLRARGDYRIFTDVDLAYPLEMISELADRLAAGRDVVIASRAHPESEVLHHAGLEGYLRRRKLQSTLFSTAARVLLKITCRDPQAGLKGLSARAVSLMLPYVKCQGFGFDCELLVACRYFGIDVCEMPVKVVYESTSTTTHLTSGAAMLGELLGIRRHWQAIARGGLERSILVTASHLDEARRYRQRRAERLQRRAAART
jgi:glycosyltransferase involved in cell wall biosynthesis